MKKLISMEQAANLIKDNDVVTVSSASGLGCPDAVLAAVGKRFQNESHPHDLTMIHPIAAGDMYGIKGIEHLARKGLIKTVIAGSYPSGPSSLPMPEIWRMIVDNEIAAYNVPSGVLFDLHTDAAAKRPGVITAVGLDTFADPERQGCAMNALAAENPIVKKIEFNNQQWLHYFSIIPNVAIIRATTADERGNLSYEHEGGLLGVMEQALAVRNNGGIVIAQVKRITRAGALNPHHVHISCNLVDFIVVDPEQMQTTKVQYDPAISGEIQQPDSVFDVAAWNMEKIIARRAALQLKKGMVANLGFGISANVPRILLEEGLNGQVTWVIEQGAVGGMPLLGFAFGCAANADAIVPASSQFTYFQGGGFDIALLSFLQIDKNGNVNVSKLPGKPYLTAGCGGFVDITTHAKRLVFSGFFKAGAKQSVETGQLIIHQEGKTRKFIDEVDHVTFSGKMALERGQDVIYITERCVMKLTSDGLMVTEIAPGINLESDILAQADFQLLVSPDLKVMDSAIFMENPMQLKLREFK
ncbi:acyl CoA:acetate/3-ketoacid CoA transferase [Sodalis ligni]|uniref:Acetate CoA-transferase YdiF n=1 Tax=Sodalis ligni TaxID=2697027 RepID=A0A4R1NFM1_9GAMM|nr:acyl CoA:acetate/3-ketoacid CoA transferase [Sodalis ligni]TCL06273.1 propionate CoA-transferase [Sodalis ligni]